MAHIIDTRQNGGDLVVLGDAIVVPTSTSTETGLAGGLRRNPVNGAIEAYVGVGTGAYAWRSITSGIGGGGVLRLVAGTGMTGGTITGVGTIALANTTVTPGTYTVSTIVVDAQGRITTASSGTASGVVGVTNVATGIGLTGGPITAAGTISLANTAVTPGTYTVSTIVVDAQGRITSASSGSAGAGGGTVTNVATGTGLTGGPITGAGTIALANTAVSAGTYPLHSIVVDQQGRITNATAIEPTSDNRHYARRNAAWAPIPYDLFVAVSDETTDITVGVAKLTFRVKRAITLERVSAELSVASSSGAVAVDVNRAGSTILTATLSLAASSFYTDTTSFVSASLAVGDVITIDIDTAGTGAKGLKVALLGWLV
jgi:hypothetical protein